MAAYYVNKYTGDKQWEVPTKPARATDAVRASHILVKHTGSRNPRSWRADPVTLSKDEALEKLRGLRERVVAGESFEEIASQESDCGSAKRGGDLGWFSRGQMQKPFEEATYALNVGELSQAITTDSGVHIIRRTG